MNKPTLSPCHARRKLAVSYQELHALLGRAKRYAVADIERILASRPKPPRRTRGPQVTVNPHGLTPKQAAQHLGISQPSLAWAANAGAIPRVKRGRVWTRYLPEHLDSPAVQETARKIRAHEADIAQQAEAMQALSRVARRMVKGPVAVGRSFGYAMQQAQKSQAAQQQQVAK